MNVSAPAFQPSAGARSPPVASVSMSSETSHQASGASNPYANGPIQSYLSPISELFVPGGPATWADPSTIYGRVVAIPPSPSVSRSTLFVNPVLSPAQPQEDESAPTPHESYGTLPDGVDPSADHLAQLRQVFSRLEHLFQTALSGSTDEGLQQRADQAEKEKDLAVREAALARKEVDLGAKELKMAQRDCEEAKRQNGILAEQVSLLQADLDQARADLVASSSLSKDLAEMTNQLEEERQRSIALEDTHLVSTRKLQDLIKALSVERPAASPVARAQTTAPAPAPARRVGNPFLAALINGNELVFDPALMKKGTAGGQQAARDLIAFLTRTTAALYLSKNRSGDVSGCKAVVQVFFDKQALAEVLNKAGQLPKWQTFSGFLNGFISAEGLISVVDVGGAPNAVKAKIISAIASFEHDPDCKQIFLGVTPDDDFQAPLHFARYIDPASPVRRATVLAQTGVSIPGSAASFSDLYIEIPPSLPVFDRARPPSSVRITPTTTLASLSSAPSTSAVSASRTSSLASTSPQLPKQRPIQPTVAKPTPPPTFATSMSSIKSPSAPAASVPAPAAATKASPTPTPASASAPGSSTSRFTASTPAYFYAPAQKASSSVASSSRPSSPSASTTSLPIAPSKRAVPTRIHAPTPSTSSLPPFSILHASASSATSVTTGTSTPTSTGSGWALSTEEELSSLAPPPAPAPSDDVTGGWGWADEEPDRAPAQQQQGGRNGNGGGRSGGGGGGRSGGRTGGW